MSDVTCALEETDQVGDGEQSSICSQVLGSTASEPHGTMIDHQQMDVSTSYQSQTSSDIAYIQLDSDTNHGHNASHKEVNPTKYHQWENSQACQPLTTVNSLSSEYISPFELGCYQNQSGDDPGGAPILKWNLGLYQENSSYQPHCSNSSLATRGVYFEFPQCESQN